MFMCVLLNLQSGSLQAGQSNSSIHRAWGCYHNLGSGTFPHDRAYVIKGPLHASCNARAFLEFWSKGTPIPETSNYSDGSIGPGATDGPVDGAIDRGAAATYVSLGTSTATE